MRFRIVVILSGFLCREGPVHPADECIGPSLRRDVLVWCLSVLIDC